MAAVYKSISKATGKDEESGSKQKIRNKVLILSSRGVTFRFASPPSAPATTTDEHSQAPPPHERLAVSYSSQP